MGVHAIGKKLELVLPLVLISQHLERRVFGADDNGSDSLRKHLVGMELVVSAAPERKFAHRPENLCP